MAQARNILRRVAHWATLENIEHDVWNNYKGTRGRIGIVGGARDYAGAPYFAAISTMRLGADLAYVICSAGASQAIKSYSPDLIVVPLLDTPNEAEFETEIDCLLTRLHAIVIGPGLGREKSMQSRAKNLINKAKARSLPLVLDADSLMLVNDDPSIIKSYSKAILTPNRIELQRLLNVLYAPKTYDLRNMPTSEIEELVRLCSKDLNVTILAKGMVDIICSSNFTLKIDHKLGSSRRCGGQGDILSGILGVFMAWIEQVNKVESTNAIPIENPAVWAGYLAAVATRYSNKLAFEQHGGGMLASDMISHLYKALDDMLNLDFTKNPLLKLGDNSGPKLVRNANYIGSLNTDEIGRYARQMIMDEFGPERQISLKEASALIIGAGGLGCPAAIYLGAGGIGRLGIVDDDKVEVSNLHRQILHNLDKVGMLKTHSIKLAIEATNPNVKIDEHPVRLSRHNAVNLIKDYDIVIDATDNLTTRYLINDACIVAKKPLVSGAALKMDGQLTVYNYDSETPCFRCLFPEPPAGAAIGSCSENGVLGVLPGVIGVLQALEALKILSGMRPAYAGKMLLFDGQTGQFRHVTISKRKANCEACGSSSKLDSKLIDYDEWCGQTTCKSNQPASDILNTEERVTVEEYSEILESKLPHVLIDVRPLSHSKISRFAHAIQLPITTLLNNDKESLNQIREALVANNTNQIYVVCRKGIASQRGTRIIQDLCAREKSPVVVKDIIGGMTTWARCIDTTYACM